MTSVAASTAASASGSISGISVSARRAQVPLSDVWLVAVGVAPRVVDRAEHRCRVVVLHERTGAVVDALAGDRHVVGVHDAVDESTQHPLRQERRLRVDDRLEEGEISP